MVFMARLLKFLCLALAISFVASPVARAHMFVTGSDLYVRIVKHPEMRDHYSYGVCAKKSYDFSDLKRGVPMDKIRGMNHTHADCVVPEGKYWWYLPNPENYVPLKGKAPNLLDILQWDDKGRGYLNAFEIATIIVGWKVATKATSFIFKEAAKKRKMYIRALRWMGKFFTDLTVDGVVAVAMWEVAKGISDKMDHDHYRKTQPFTEYKNWIDERKGVNEKGIKIDYVGRLTIPKAFMPQEGQDCMEHCFNNAFKIRNRLSKWYDGYSTLGFNRFANYPEDPNLAEEWLVYRSYPAVCELKCAQNYRMPTFEELWALVMPLLAESSPREYKRVLFDMSAPWEDSKWRITYMTPALMAKHIGSKRFGGECLIGSTCDAEHEMATPHMNAIDQRSFEKISKQDLMANYSTHVNDRLMKLDQHRYAHSNPDETDEQGVYGIGDHVVFSDQYDYEHIQIFNALGNEIFMDEYIEEGYIDLSHITEPGMYYIVLPTVEGDFQHVHKVVVGAH